MYQEIHLEWESEFPLTRNSNSQLGVGVGSHRAHTPYYARECYGRQHVSHIRSVYGYGLVAAIRYVVSCSSPDSCPYESKLPNGMTGSVSKATTHPRAGFFLAGIPARQGPEFRVSRA